MQEKTWRDSGYSSGRPKVFYAFKNALDEHMRDEKINSYLKINDLTDVFDSLTEQVYIDTGHVSRVGNVMIAERIADTLHKKN